MYFIFVFFLQLFIYISPFKLDEKKKEMLEKVIKTQMKLAKLHTVGIVITDNSTTLYQNVFSEDNKATNKTPFVLGSISKSITALAILKLNISLNKTLDQFELDDYLDEKNLKDITVGELLNHTSGLDGFTRKRIKPRGNYSYSNYGFGLLGKIIEHESHKNYSQYVKEEIFDPLHMINTRAIYDESIIDSYNNFFGVRCKYNNLEYEITQKEGFYIPSGYISSSVEDMGNYLRFYLDKNNTEYVSRITGTNFVLENNKYYGMAMTITNRSDYIIYKHGGSVVSFLSDLIIYPDLDLGFFITTNTNDNLCPQPANQFFVSIHSFLIYDVFNKVDSSLFFYVHFTLDIVSLFVISFPVTYLVMTLFIIIKKINFWFIDIKGKILFGIDILVFSILPIIIYIYCFGIDGMGDVAIHYSNDLFFTVVTCCVAMWLIFIIKIVYLFSYKKFNMENNEKRYENLVPINLNSND